MACHDIILSVSGRSRIMASRTIGTHGKLGKPERNTFGPSLRTLRENLQLSAEEVAARMELQNVQYLITVSANHLHKIERQEKALTDNLLLAYLEATETNLIDFIKSYEEQKA